MQIEQPDLKTIATLSTSQIHGSFTDEDLIRIIRSVDYPFSGKERLEFFDRDTLERVVCLIRRWSQQRIAAAGRSSRGLASEAFDAEPVTCSGHTI